VTAPDDGIVTKVDDLQVGGFVNPGAPVFSLLSSKRVWIEAKFSRNRPGPTCGRVKEATIDVDAYPDRKFNAHIVRHESGHWF